MENEKDYVEIDLLTLGRAIAAQWKGIFLVMLLFVAVAGIWGVVSPKSYEVNTTLRIKQAKGISRSPLDMEDISSSAQRIGTYVEILKSRNVLMPVIEEIETEYTPEKAADYYERYRKSVNIEAVKNTELLTIKFTARDSDKAYRGAQILTQGFLERMAYLSGSEQAKTKTFLEERTKQAKVELESADKALQAYKTSHQIINPSDSAGRLSAQISSAESMARENRIALDAARARLAAIEGQLQESGASIAENQFVSAYNAQLAKLEVSRISYAEKYTDKHPNMIAINDEIANIESKRDEEIEKIVSMEVPSHNSIHSGLLAGKYKNEAEIAVLEEKERALGDLISQNNGELKNLSAIEQEYVDLARKVQLASDTYSLLAKRLEEAKIAATMNPDDVQIIDEPSLAVSSKKIGRTMLIAAVLGFLLGCAVIVFKEIMHPVIASEEELTESLQLPVLGVIPDKAALAEAMEKWNNKGVMEKIGGFLWGK